MTPRVLERLLERRPGRLARLLHVLERPRDGLVVGVGPGQERAGAGGGVDGRLPGGRASRAVGLVRHAAAAAGQARLGRVAQALRRHALALVGRRGPRVALARPARARSGCAAAASRRPRAGPRAATSPTRSAAAAARPSSGGASRLRPAAARARSAGVRLVGLVSHLCGRDHRPLGSGEDLAHRQVAELDQVAPLVLELHAAAVAQQVLVLLVLAHRLPCAHSVALHRRAQRLLLLWPPGATHVAGCCAAAVCVFPFLCCCVIDCAKQEGEESTTSGG